MSTFIFNLFSPKKTPICEELGFGILEYGFYIKLYFPQANIGHARPIAAIIDRRILNRYKLLS